MTNDQLVLVCGEAVGGKSASLQNIKNPEGAIYLNCEAGKKLPFPAKFKQLIITDPLTVFAVFDEAEKPANAHVHTIIIDSLTYLMDMYESTHVLTAKDTMKGWSEYQQYFKKLMQQYVAKSTKNVIFTAHTLATLNENEHVMERKVPVKGALKNVGLESYFSMVVAAKKIQLSQLEKYSSDLLTFSPDEEMLGFKYVFQTRLTKETVNERIRAAMGMWEINETYINNDVQILLDRLTAYYGTAIAA